MNSGKAPPHPLGRIFLNAILGREGLGIVGMGGLSAVLGFAIPLIMARIFENGIPSKEPGALTQGLIAAGVGMLGLALLDLASALLRSRLHCRIGYDLKRETMERLLSLPTSAFRRSSVGETVTRSGLSDDEVERLWISISSSYSAVLGGAASWAAIFLIDARLGALVLAPGILVLAIGYASFRRLIRRERETLELVSRNHAFLIQIFGGVSKIRSCGAERWVYDRWVSRFDRRRALELDSNRIQGAAATFQSVLPLICTAGIFFLLTGSAGGSAMPAGRFAAFLSAFTLYVGGLIRVSGAICEMAAVLPRLERARPIWSQPAERSSFGTRKHELRGRIEFRNLSFRHPGSAGWAIRDVDARIDAGQFVALVGASGSGKSTLLRLLLGFEKPDQGEIFLDDVALSGLDPLHFRRQIGTVLQHDHLMTGTIYENLSIVKPLSLEQAWQAARLAGLEPDIRRMPMGMHSLITQGGRAYSGGERQRIMLARALAGEPKLLVLDEATSSLDPVVQTEVMANLERLRVTRIVAAHRLSTIREADQIWVFERGRIAERGRFEELIRAKGPFEKLMRSQANGMETNPRTYPPRQQPILQAE